MKKLFKVLKSIINIAITLMVIAFVLVVCLQRFSNNEISIFSYRMFTVVSGSMVPEYEIGDVLISKETDPALIKVGDDVSYLGKSGTFKDKVVTHRVIKIEKDADGKYVFHTKGIANIVADPVVHEDQLYGVVKRKDILLSFVYKCVSTKTGMFLFVGIPILYIIGSEMLSFMLEKEEERRKKLKDTAKKENAVKREDKQKEENKEEIKNEDKEVKKTKITKNKKASKK